MHRAVWLRGLWRSDFADRTGRARCSGRLRGGGFGGDALGGELESREHPEVVREDRPTDEAFAGGEGFSATGTAGKMLLEDRDARLGAAAPPEAGAEGLVCLQTFLQLGGITGTEPAFDFPPREFGFVGLAAEAAITPDALEGELHSVLQSDHGGENQRGVGRGAGQQLVAKAEAGPAFAEPESIATFNVGAGFAAFEQTNFVVVETEDFFGVGHRPFADDALVRLGDGGGEVSEHLVEAAQNDLRLFFTQPGLGPVRGEQ